jgi:xylan 1,4-beta-xylosidase
MNWVLTAAAPLALAELIAAALAAGPMTTALAAGVAEAPMITAPATAVAATVADGAANEEHITIAAAAPGIAMPHFWEQMFGSGRAILSLRESYRQDLRSVKQITDLRHIRFHNIFHDEVGLMNLDKDGRPTYNFSYVDQIYDGLLDNGVRPFVEIGFMPAALTSNVSSIMSFWYRPNVAPPKDYAAWDALVRNFAAHLVERYGIDEVAQWYFEVWNEPNIEFWSGNPRQPTYFELYAHTAGAIKSINPRLRVGGPATAQAAWIPEFLRYARAHGAPVDFVSSHVYANDTPQDVFGETGAISREHMVCRAVRKLHDEILDSPYPTLPLILSEFNASYKNEPMVTDSVFMGPWIADTIRQCAGLVQLMSYWSFSDVFEEQGVVKTPFYGGFGLIAERGIPKPAYNAFALLHKLGEQRIPVDSESALVTKRSDGTLVIALWNIAEPEPAGRVEPREPAEPAKPFIAAKAAQKRFTVTFEGLTAAHVKLWRLDADHGNVLRAFDAMGRPAFPSAQQIDQLRAASKLTAPEDGVLPTGGLEVWVPGQGLVVAEISH